MKTPECDENIEPPKGDENSGDAQNPPLSPIVTKTPECDENIEPPKGDENSGD